MRLVLDAMGGDHAPSAPVEGGVLFARAHPGHEVFLVGDEAKVAPLLGKLRPPSNLQVHHASEVVEMDEHASSAFRRKRDSSLRVGFELVRDGRAEALVSAGNSGAVMAGGLLTLGRLPGVERPAIAALFPALKGGGRCLLLDAGANVDCKPSHLAQFAVMGEAYVRARMGVARPRVAVLSNGEESSKGTPLTREASELLRRSDLDFVGYVEGKDLFSGEVQVVVTDGFTGNVVLKTSEGVGMGVIGMLRQAIERRGGLAEKVGAMLLQPALAGLRRVVDYAEYGGAPLLGIQGVGIVAHGRSTPRALFNALGAALAMAEGGVQAELTRCIGRAGAWLPTHPKGKRATDAGVSD
ncbi:MULTISPECIES: phosphate acyltransferase PlsX [Myxococcus]|uniref:Phosphate acyltransferase n=1 Tax=Myxococcus xanthus TaxID=34 RepID=A0AAE6KTY3_MYXXA|nr:MULTISPECIES: phosphate acyltransferase PlsX [Myxococcus]QDE69726.1 phosphate acyltransferase [Myxococcus xanthus]QDE77005.1 phosphate acyltransferase [Myxococcus xanthus]QDE84396.1 phosphate acyltransferase [Myxococcus xanthus]QDE98563.1 phosphate acyltransferase [Myxococcus xanthus]QDF06269.1 phosphate acyltransferase [Myxococcus xanthus]